SSRGVHANVRARVPAGALRGVTVMVGARAKASATSAVDHVGIGGRLTINETLYLPGSHFERTVGSSATPGMCTVTEPSLGLACGLRSRGAGRSGCLNRTVIPPPLRLSPSTKMSLPSCALGRGLAGLTSWINGAGDGTENTPWSLAPRVRTGSADFDGCWLSIRITVAK